MILIFWGGWPIVNAFWSISIGELPPNEFGDSFGGLSALFTGLAFLGLVYSIVLQRSDLDQTLKELRAQNQLLADTAALDIYEGRFQQMIFDIWGEIQPFLRRRYIEETANWEKDKPEDLTLQRVSVERIDTWISSVMSQRKNELEWKETRIRSIPSDNDAKKKTKIKDEINFFSQMIDSIIEEIEALKIQDNSFENQNELSERESMLIEFKERVDLLNAKLKDMEEETNEERQKRYESEIAKLLYESKSDKLPFENCIVYLNNLKQIVISWEAANRRITDHIYSKS